MKGELKAGGLALVVRSNEKEDIGKCVTLVKMVRSGEMYTAPDGTLCRHNAGFVPSWLVKGDVKPERSAPYQGWAVFIPQCLIPIDDADPDAVDENIYFIPTKTILISD